MRLADGHGIDPDRISRRARSGPERSYRSGPFRERVRPRPVRRAAAGLRSSLNTYGSR